MILVTGGAGFMGAHTCVELLESGYEIVIVDNLCNSDESVIKNISKITGKDIIFYRVDVCNYEKLHKVFAECKIDAVLHFAGFKAVGESVEKPLSYYRNNLVATLTLCRLMDEYRCRRIVFSSSATVYGVNNNPPFTEDMPVLATNPYGKTKLMQEQILTDLKLSDKRWSIAILRYFNPIGAHISGLIGENPRGIPNNLMPYICKVAIGNLPFLNIFGNDYNTPDGTCVRDYVHVMDIASGHIAALRYIETHDETLLVNLGRGEGLSVLDVVHAFESVTGKTIPFKFVSRRSGDVDTCWANITKAYNLLGWRANRTLNEMCADSWRYVRNLFPVY
jgi:UDP-glucose 4-epimerase